MRGVPRSGLWSEERFTSSGIGSERAKVASVAEGKPPASRGPPVIGGAAEEGGGGKGKRPRDFSRGRLVQPMASRTCHDERSNSGLCYPAASFMISAIAVSTSWAIPESDGSLNIGSSIVGLSVSSTTSLPSA